MTSYFKCKAFILKSVIRCVKLSNCIIIFETMKYKLIECKGAIYFTMNLNHKKWFGYYIITINDFSRFVLEVNVESTNEIFVVYFMRFAALNGCIRTMLNWYKYFAINLSFSMLVVALGKRILTKQFLCNLLGCAKCYGVKWSHCVAIWMKTIKNPYKSN